MCFYRKRKRKNKAIRSCADSSKHGSGFGHEVGVLIDMGAFWTAECRCGHGIDKQPGM